MKRKVNLLSIFISFLNLLFIYSFILPNISIKKLESKFLVSPFLCSSVGKNLVIYTYSQLKQCPGTINRNIATLKTFIALMACFIPISGNKKLTCP